MLETFYCLLLLCSQQIARRFGYFYKRYLNENHTTHMQHMRAAMCPCSDRMETLLEGETRVKRLKKKSLFLEAREVFAGHIRLIFKHFHTHKKGD